MASMRASFSSKLFGVFSLIGRNAFHASPQAPVGEVGVDGISGLDVAGIAQRAALERHDRIAQLQWPFWIVRFEPARRQIQDVTTTRHNAFTQAGKSIAATLDAPTVIRKGRSRPTVQTRSQLGEALGSLLYAQRGMLRRNSALRRLKPTPFGGDVAFQRISQRFGRSIGTLKRIG